MPKDIFISYSRKDLVVVTSLKKEMEQQTGVSCWMDLTGIESGDQFQDVIIRAIEQSKIVLFMMTENSIESEFTKKEILYAKNIKKRIVPIMLNGFQPKGWFLFEFGGIDYIDISNSIQKNKLFRDIRNWTGKTPKETPNKPEKKTVRQESTIKPVPTITKRQQPDSITTTTQKGSKKEYLTSPNTPVTEELYRQYKQGLADDFTDNLHGVINVISVGMIVFGLISNNVALRNLGIVGLVGSIIVCFLFLALTTRRKALSKKKIDPVTLSRLRQIEEDKNDRGLAFSRKQIVVLSILELAYVTTLVIVGINVFK